MADREKLIELIDECSIPVKGAEGHTFAHYSVRGDEAEYLADHLIANGVTVTDNNVGCKWIPVTERLPSKNQRVLACRPLNDGSFVFWAKQWDNKWFDMEWNCIRYGVTHWMPLPTPPKGE